MPRYFVPLIAMTLLLLQMSASIGANERGYEYDKAGNLIRVFQVNLQNDTKNCGVIGNVCSPATPFCVNGHCIACDPHNDFDCDGVPDAADNCKSVKNAGQEDVDHDGVGDVCDNCPTTPNPDQLNTDGADDGGDACDPDDDNDGCPDVTDDNPQQDSSVVGWRVAANCPDGMQHVYSWDGDDSDGDGLRNCEDLDDDNDGTLDVDDPCPIDAGNNLSVCQAPPISCPLTIPWNVCRFGGCEILSIKIASVINPPVVIRKFTIRGNSSIIVYADAKQPIRTIKSALLGKNITKRDSSRFFSLSLLENFFDNIRHWLKAPKSADSTKVRLEIWSKDNRGEPGELVAKIAEYPARSVKRLERTGDAALILSVEGNGSAISLQRAAAPPVSKIDLRDVGGKTSDGKR